MKLDKKFWATSFTLTGTIIGAGILGLPYVFSRSGFFIGSFWLIFLGLILTYVFLCLGEVSLRTKKDRQLPGLARRYLGRKAEILMFFAILFGIYSALLAYIIGEAQSLSFMFTGGYDHSLYFGLGFWFVMVFLSREGLRGLQKVETWGVLAIIIIILSLLAIYLPSVNYANFSNNDYSNLFLPFGVVLFALMGFNSIPELELMIKGNEKKFKSAIILGATIPIVLYLIFSFVFIGVLGSDVPQVATLAFGKPVTLLGIFTMLTSYFVLSFSLKDVYEFDLQLSREMNFFLVFVLPILIYLVMYFIDFLDFISIIGLGGVISGGLTGMLILLISKSAKSKGNRKPEYEVPLNWGIIIIITLVFILGIISEII